MDKKYLLTPIIPNEATDTGRQRQINYTRIYSCLKTQSTMKYPTKGNIAIKSVFLNGNTEPILNYEITQ